MPSPKPKQVSNDSMARIRAAIHTLNDDPTTPRTKRELQRRTGLSHDLVVCAVSPSGVVFRGLTCCS